MRTLAHILEPRRPNICFAESDAVESEVTSSGGEETQEVEESVEGEEAEDDGLEDLEIGPTRHRVTKDIKDGWDGLQRTVQTTKEEFKGKETALAQERERVQAEATFVRTFVKEIGQIESISEQLAPYEKLTLAEWTAWAEQDPSAASKAQVAMNALVMKRGQLQNGLQAKYQEQERTAAQEREQRKTQAERDLAAQVKDWSPAKRETLTKVANAAGGFSQADIDGIAHIPGVWKILDLAAAQLNAQAKAKAVAKKPDAPPPEPLIQRSRGNAPANTTKPSDRDSPDEFRRKFLAGQKAYKQNH